METRKAAVVALGMFDGMHIGHCALVGRAAALARELGALAVVDTFSNHPAEVLGGSVRMLSDAAERESRMRLCGADEVHMPAFTRAFADQPPEQFIEAELARWDVRAFVVGFNYTFGAKGMGTPDTLGRLGERYGFAVETVPPVLYRGSPVSSTRIRAALESGDVASASDMLGRPYTLTGNVTMHGRIDPRDGFPAAAIAYGAGRVLPKSGVYATFAEAAGKAYAAMTHVGAHPPGGGKAPSMETRLLDGDGDLCGGSLTISFLDRVRDEAFFDSAEALQEQLMRDAKAARARCAAAGRPDARTVQNTR